MLTTTLLTGLLSASPAFTDIATPPQKDRASEDFLSADGHRVEIVASKKNIYDEVTSPGFVREVNDSSGNTRRYFLDGRIEAIDNDGKVWKL